MMFDDFFEELDQDDLAPRSEVCRRCHTEKSVSGECVCDDEGDVW